MLVRDIYTSNPNVIAENLTIRDVIERLISNDYNGLLVINDKEKLVGVLSLQDIVGHIVPKEMQEHSNLASSMYIPGFFKEQCVEVGDKLVKQIMRREFIVADLDDSLMEIAADFLHNDLYIVPVVEKGDIVGIITRSEIKKALALALDISVK